MAAFTNLLLVESLVIQLRKKQKGVHSDLLYLVGWRRGSFVDSLKFSSMAMMIRITAAISMSWSYSVFACIVDRLRFGPVSVLTAILRQSGTKSRRGSSVIMGGWGVGLTTVATWEASGQVIADVIRDCRTIVGTIGTLVVAENRVSSIVNLMGFRVNWLENNGKNLLALSQCLKITEKVASTMWAKRARLHFEWPKVQ